MGTSPGSTLGSLGGPRVMDGAVAALYQPAPLGLVLRVAVASFTPWSTFTRMASVRLLPAWSVARTCTVLVPSPGLRTQVRVPTSHGENGPVVPLRHSTVRRPESPTPPSR